MGYVAAYGGMGDDAAGMSPVDMLVAQINRFGPIAPLEHRIIPSTISTMGNPAVTMEIAIPAIVIAHRRANEAYQRFGDAGSLQAINEITGAYANPVGYVTARLPSITSTLRAYGDSLGLPAAASAGQGIPSAYMLLAAAAILFLLFRKGG